MDVLTSETCSAVNNKASDIKLAYLYSTIKMTHGPINIIKQVTSVGLSLFNYQDDARSNKHNKASDIKLVYLYSTIKMTHGPINIRKHTVLVKMRTMRSMAIAKRLEEMRHSYRNSPGEPHETT